MAVQLLPWELWPTCYSSRLKADCWCHYFQLFEKVIKYEMCLCSGTCICHLQVTTQWFTQRSQGNYKVPPVLRSSSCTFDVRSVTRSPGWKERICSIRAIRLCRCEQVPSRQGWNQCCHSYPKDDTFCELVSIWLCRISQQFFSSFYCQFISWYLAIFSNQAGVRMLLGKQFTQHKNKLKWSDYKCIYFEKLRKK